MDCGHFQIGCQRILDGAASRPRSLSAHSQGKPNLTPFDIDSTPALSTQPQLEFDFGQRESAFDRLPQFAEALAQAGCANEEILAHCRQPGRHVRGCWVVDLFMPKP